MFEDDFAPTRKSDGGAQDVGLSAQEFELFTGPRNVGWFVKCTLSQSKCLVGAEYQPPRHILCDGAGFFTRQKCGSVRRVLKTCGRRDPALLDIGRRHFT